jgi:hypothetical protein
MDVAGKCKETDPIKTKCWHPAFLTEKDIVDRKISLRDPEAPIDPARAHLEVIIGHHNNSHHNNKTG